MDFGRMYSSRTLPSAVNEFDSSDWLIRIYHGVDSIILVRSQEGNTSQLLLPISIRTNVKFCCLAYCQNIHFQLYKCLHLRIWLWVIKSWKTFKKGPIQAWKSFLVNKAFFTCMNCKWHIFSNRILHGVHMWSVLFILLIIWNISCHVIKKCVFSVLWKIYEQHICVLLLNSAKYIIRPTP